MRVVRHPLVDRDLVALVDHIDEVTNGDFAAAAPAALVSTHCFESLYHEIFNELDAAPVFAVLRQWLDQRF